jgi:hypothetical protein
MSILGAGKSLGIKPSTAKLIMKKYRETGTFSTRNSKDVDTDTPEQTDEDSTPIEIEERDIEMEKVDEVAEVRLPIVP